MLTLECLELAGPDDETNMLNELFKYFPMMSRDKLTAIAKRHKYDFAKCCDELVQAEDVQPTNNVDEDVKNILISSFAERYRSLSREVIEEILESNNYDVDV